MRDDLGHGAAGADRHEEHDDDPDRERVDEQHAPVAEPREDPRHQHLQAHGGQGLGHDQEARLDRRVAEAELVEERQEERHPADAEAGGEAPGDRRPGRSGS